MSEDGFHTRRRMREVRAAIKNNFDLHHSGEDYMEVISFLEDIARNLASHGSRDEEEVFHYIIRSMGALAKHHAPYAYLPYGYDDPFAPAEPPTTSTSYQEAKWKWPIVNKPPMPGETPLDSSGFRNYSALKMFGYTVGKTEGWPASKRRSFLTSFMEMELPAAVEGAFGPDYGSPLSTDRLRKVANVIAANASNFFRNDPRRYDVAIAEWEEDLQFLKDRYYDGFGLKFEPWPSTRSR